MATWEITSLYKKSAYEITFFTKEGKVLSREEGYRWGQFECDSDERPEVDLSETFEVDSDWELVELDDGCWADWGFPDGLTEEEQAEIETAYDDNHYEGLEELGWSQCDTEYYLGAPLKLTNKDTGEEFTENDPAVVEREVKPSVTLHPTAAWPFGNTDENAN